MSTASYQIIAVDFDGTLCYSNWPELGEPNRPLIEYLIDQKRSGKNSRKITCDYYIDDKAVLPAMVNA